MRMLVRKFGVKQTPCEHIEVSYIASEDITTKRINKIKLV